MVRTHLSLIEDADLGVVADRLGQMAEEAHSLLASEGVAEADREVVYSLGMRYEGQAHELDLQVAPGEPGSGSDHQNLHRTLLPNVVLLTSERAGAIGYPSRHRHWPGSQTVLPTPRRQRAKCGSSEDGRSRSLLLGRHERDTGISARVASARGDAARSGDHRGGRFHHGGIPRMGRARRRRRQHHSRFGLVPPIAIPHPIRRPCAFIRPGARCAVMLSHHKRRATPPGDAQGRPKGRFSRSLGASATLDDGPASPARRFLPREREKRSYGVGNCDGGY